MLSKLPHDATDAQSLSAVRSWADALASGDYDAAFSWSMRVLIGHSCSAP